jgi:hypothetical protein
MRTLKVSIYIAAAAVIAAAMIYAKATGKLFEPLVNKGILTLSAALIEIATIINVIQKRKNKDALYTSTGIIIGLFLIVLWSWIAL